MIAGQQFTPTLRLVRPLGQGAMGTLWVADHLALGTQVAIKVMSSTYAHDPEMVARFRREAMAAAQIKHPHVAQVFDHGVTADGAPYIVMELLEGETLKSRIQRLGALPLTEVARVVGQTAKALGRAHQLGIVHRDVKPDNLFLIDMDGELFVKVLDFGIAKQQRNGELGITATGNAIGTPYFMSPEQLLSAKHVDLRADLWSLGVAAYQALTTELPFPAETLGALAVAVHAGVFRPPSALRPGLPPGVDAWMARALQRQAAARFGSAKEMAQALEEAIGVPRAPMTSGWDLGPAMGTAGAPAVGMQGGTQRLSDSANAALPMGGSGINVRTLQGFSATGGRGGTRRAPLALAAVLVGGFVAAGGVFVVTRSGVGENAAEHAEGAEGAAAPAQAAATPASAVATGDPAGEATGGPSTSASAPAAGTAGPESRAMAVPNPATTNTKAGALPAARASAAPTARATAAPIAPRAERPVHTGEVGRPTAKDPTKKAPTKPDDIGF